MCLGSPRLLYMFSIKNDAQDKRRKIDGCWRGMACECCDGTWRDDFRGGAGLSVVEDVMALSTVCAEALRFSMQCSIEFTYIPIYRLWRLNWGFSLRNTNPMKGARVRVVPGGASSHRLPVNLHIDKGIR